MCPIRAGYRQDVASRDQVLHLLELGYTYQTAGPALHISAGQAFMTATGVPADGSDSDYAHELASKGVQPGSTQHLVNPRSFNPMRNPRVIRWVGDRAARELVAGSS